MKNIMVSLLTTLGIMTATSAFANVVAQSGVYGGVLGGWSFASAPSASNAGAQSTSNKNYTGGVNVGYEYAFNNNWLGGLELGYMYFGQTNYTNPNGNILTTGAQALLTGTYLDSSGFNVFLKAGGINEYSKVSNASIDTPVQNNNTKVAKWIPAAVVGVGYMPVQNLNIALQYEHTFGENWDQASSSNNVTKPITQNAVTLGLTYKFAL